MSVDIRGIVGYGSITRDWKIFIERVPLAAETGLFGNGIENADYIEGIRAYVGMMIDSRLGRGTVNGIWKNLKSAFGDSYGEYADELKKIVFDKEETVYSKIGKILDLLKKANYGKESEKPYRNMKYIRSLYKDLAKINAVVSTRERFDGKKSYSDRFKEIRAEGTKILDELFKKYPAIDEKALSRDIEKLVGRYMKGTLRNTLSYEIKKIAMRRLAGEKLDDLFSVADELAKSGATALREWREKRDEEIEPLVISAPGPAFVPKNVPDEVLMAADASVFLSKEIYGKRITGTPGRIFYELMKESTGFDEKRLFDAIKKTSAVSFLGDPKRIDSDVARLLSSFYAIRGVLEKNGLESAFYYHPFSTMSSIASKIEKTAVEKRSEDPMWDFLAAAIRNGEPYPERIVNEVMKRVEKEVGAKGKGWKDTFRLYIEKFESEGYEKRNEMDLFGRRYTPTGASLDELFEKTGKAVEAVSACIDSIMARERLPQEIERGFYEAFAELAEAERRKDPAPESEPSWNLSPYLALRMERALYEKWWGSRIMDEKSVNRITKFSFAVAPNTIGFKRALSKLKISGDKSVKKAKKIEAYEIGDRIYENVMGRGSDGGNGDVNAEELVARAVALKDAFAKRPLYERIASCYYSTVATYLNAWNWGEERYSRIPWVTSRIRAESGKNPDFTKFSAYLDGKISGKTLAGSIRSFTKYAVSPDMNEELKELYENDPGAKERFLLPYPTLPSLHLPKSKKSADGKKIAFHPVAGALDDFGRMATFMRILAEGDAEDSKVDAARLGFERRLSNVVRYIEETKETELYPNPMDLASSGEYEKAFNIVAEELATIIRNDVNTLATLPYHMRNVVYQFASRVYYTVSGADEDVVKTILDAIGKSEEELKKERKEQYEIFFDVFSDWKTLRMKDALMGFYFGAVAYLKHKGLDALDASAKDIFKYAVRTEVYLNRVSAFPYMKNYDYDGDVWKTKALYPYATQLHPYKDYLAKGLASVRVYPYTFEDRPVPLPKASRDVKKIAEPIASGMEKSLVKILKSLSELDLKSVIRETENFFEEMGMNEDVKLGDLVLDVGESGEKEDYVLIARRKKRKDNEEKKKTAKENADFLNKYGFHEKFSGRKPGEKRFNPFEVLKKIVEIDGVDEKEKMEFFKKAAGFVYRAGKAFTSQMENESMTNETFENIAVYTSEAAGGKIGRLLKLKENDSLDISKRSIGNGLVLNYEGAKILLLEKYPIVKKLIDAVKRKLKEEGVDPRKAFEELGIAIGECSAEGLESFMGGGSVRVALSDGKSVDIPFDGELDVEALFAIMKEKESRNSGLEDIRWNDK